MSQYDAPGQGQVPPQGQQPQWGAPPPGYGGYPQPPYPYGPPLQPNNDKAVLALVLGGLCLTVFPPLGIGAVIVGMRSRREIAAGRGSGDGLAMTGVILGWFGIAITVIILIIITVVIGVAVTRS